MAKSKSSASSATRKKHQKKSTTDGEEHQQQQPAQRGQKKAAKKSRFEPKIKSYTPPPATPKGIPDPVELYLQGGKNIDAELIVVLRKLVKRDESTIVKGVEGLEAWIREYLLRESSRSKSQDDADLESEEHEANNGEADWIEERKREEIVESMAVWVRSHLSNMCKIDFDNCATT